MSNSELPEFSHEALRKLKSEIAWLIERGGLCFGFRERKFSWVSFTNESALRFSRRSDAIRFIEAIRDVLGGASNLDDVLVMEHLWSVCGVPPAPAITGPDGSGNATGANRATNCHERTSPLRGVQALPHQPRTLRNRQKPYQR